MVQRFKAKIKNVKLHVFEKGMLVSFQKRLGWQIFLEL
jgi:hypothetical protein